MIKWISRVKF